MIPLADEIRAVLGDAPHELTDRGLYCHRNKASKRALRAAEEVLLRHGAVRVIDFTHDKTLLHQNAVPRDGADPAGYEGFAGPAGHRLFRADHHYEVPSLASTSSTPLVLQWLQGLWQRGRANLLREVAGSRYLADHADTDILLANYLAANALDEALVRGPAASWLAAAALRNDYVRVPPAEVEPQASRAFYTCIAIEREILDGRLPFADAQSNVLPELVRWLHGADPVDGSLRASLEAWEGAARADEQRVLQRIEAWEAQRKLTWELDGKLAILEADEKIDNADLFLYLGRKAHPPVVQALVFPESGELERKVIVKLRAHGGFDLYPLYARLRVIAPESLFDGRSAAGGSKPFAGMARADLIEAVRSVLRDAAPPGGRSLRAGT